MLKKIRFLADTDCIRAVGSWREKGTKAPSRSIVKMGLWRALGQFEVDVNRFVRRGPFPTLAQVLVAISLSHCAGTYPGSGRESSRTQAQDTKSLDAAAVNRSGLGELFKDREYFRQQGILQAVGRGRTSCKLVTQKGEAVYEGILPWDDDLKDFLTDVLDGLPSESGKNLKGRAFASIHSIYLVKKEVLQGPNQVLAAGLACDREDRTGIIFLNEFTFKTERKAKGLRNFQAFSVIPSPYLLIKSADNAAVTLVHEIFHAIDNRFFKDLTARDDFNLRRNIEELSWNNGASRFLTVDGLDLAGVAADNSQLSSEESEHLGCRFFKPITADEAGLSLAGESGQIIAKRLLDLQQTNFIVPYAQENAAEDFAESLAVYYFGAYNDPRDPRRNFGPNPWQRREVYSDDLRKTSTRSGKVIASADTKAILQGYQIQRTKMCLLASLVFKDDEATCLRNINK